MTGPRMSAFRDPFFLQWHLTDRCNLSCTHCYRTETGREDLPESALFGFIDSFARFLKSTEQPGRIHLTGGEPFLSPHWLSVLRRAKERGIPCRVLSNGTAIDDAVIRGLIEVNCQAVQISLEGTPEVNDTIRGEESYEQAMNGIRLLTRAGIPVTLNMTASKENVSELAGLLSLVEEHAARFHVNRYVPTGPEAVSAMLSQRETYALFKQIFRLRNKHRYIEIPLRDPLWHEYFKHSPKRLGDCVHGCSAGYNGLALDCDGTVYPCRRLPMPIGNLLSQSIEEIWRGSEVLRQLRNRDLLKGQCGSCKRRWICGGCRAIARAVHGDPLAEDPQCFRRLLFLGKLNARYLLRR